MGISVIKGIADPDQIGHILGAGFVVRHDEDMTVIECPRFDNEALAAALKKKEPVHDGSLDAIEAATGTASRLADARERLQLAQDNLAYHEEGCAWVDAVALSVHAEQQPKVEALRKATDALRSVPTGTSDAVTDALKVLQDASAEVALSGEAANAAKAAADAYRAHHLDEAKSRLVRYQAELDALT